MKNTAGSGKSILWWACLCSGHIKLQVGHNIFSSTIIEAVKHECGLNSTLAFAYFYFDFKDPGKQTYRNLICSLIVQLSWRFNSIPFVLQELYSQNQNGKQQPMPEALLVILKELSKPFTHTYIVGCSGWVYGHGAEGSPRLYRKSCRVGVQ